MMSNSRPSLRTAKPLAHLLAYPLILAAAHGGVVFEENFQNYTDVAPGVTVAEGITVGNDPIWANAAELNVRAEDTTLLYTDPIAVPAGNKFDLLVTLRFLNSVTPDSKEGAQTAGEAAFFDIELTAKDGKKQTVRVAADKVAGFAIPFTANSQWEKLAIKAAGANAEVYMTSDRAFRKLGTLKLEGEIASLNFLATAEKHFSLRNIVVRTPAALEGHPVEKHFADFRALSQPLSGAATAKEGDTISLVELGSERLRFQMGTTNATAMMRIAYSDGSDQKVNMRIGTQTQNLRIGIGGQMKGDKIELPDSRLIFDRVGDVYIRPDLKVYQSSYDCEPPYIDIVREWNRLPPASMHVFTVDFRQDGDTQQMFVDDSLFKTFAKDGATVTGVDITFGAGVKYKVDAKAKPDPVFTMLDLFSNPRAKAFINAKLSLAPGSQKIKGVPMIVADGLNSSDIAICKQGKGNWALEVEEYHGRSPFFGLPSAVHYRIPAAIYNKAYVLFALDPDSRKDAVLTVRMGHYMGNGSGGNMLGDVVIDLRGKDPQAHPGIEQVGTATLGGKELPLYLATVDFSKAIGRIIDIATMRDYIDFDLTGKGWENFEQLNNEIKPDPLSDSAFNVFGVTLAQAPELGFAIRQATPGNVFTSDEREKKLHVTVTDPKGIAQKLVWQARDIDGRTLFQGDTAGFGSEMAIDLGQAPVGYGTLALSLMAKDGSTLLEHDAAFAILPKNDRQATIGNSPYAVWWFAAHGSPGAPEIGGPILQKAGIHHASANLLSPENAAKYQVVGTGNIHLPRQPQFDDETGKFKPMKVKRPDPTDPAKKIDVEITGEEAIVESLKEQIAKTAFVTHLMVWHESAPGYGIPEELLLQPVPPVSEREKNKAKYVNEVGRIMRKHFPDIKIQIGNTSASIGAVVVPMRGGANPDYYDAIGIETPSQVIPPERLIEVGLQGMQISMDAANLLAKGKKKIGASGAYEFTYRTERDMGELKQAQWYVRDVLVSLANNFTLISPGILFDCLNGYYNGLWGGSGLLRRAPYCYPKPAYVAYAALTRALDGVTLVRQIPTGSTTIYALEFKRCDGRMAYALWSARGEAEFELDTAADGEVVGFFGAANTVKAGKVKISAGESPAYFITTNPIKGIAITGRTFNTDAALGKAASVASPLDDAGVLTLAPDPLVETGHRKTMLPIMEPSDRFAIATVEDEEKGKCVEVTLGAAEKPISKYITEYTTIRLPAPVAVPGNPEVVGVWVKGNSNWGQIRFEIEDAGGEIFRNISTGSSWGCDIMDWPGNLAVSFDGWSYVYTALRKTDLVITHSPGPLSEQWVSGGGDKRIDLPIKIRALTVGMNRSKLNLIGFEDSAPAIRLKDIGGCEAAGDQAPAKR